MAALLVAFVFSCLCLTSEGFAPRLGLTRKITAAYGKPFERNEAWAKELGLEPGYGGYWPGDPNAPKYKVTVRSKKTGLEYVAMVPRDRYMFFVFEEQGIDLPIVNKERMCRQGCCTQCTFKVIEGTYKMDTPLGLLKEMRQQGNALSCCAYPLSDIVCELQSEDEMYLKQWSEGFEGGGVEWGGFFLDED
jgi:ferredoxin